MGTCTCRVDSVKNTSSFIVELLHVELLITCYLLRFVMICLFASFYVNVPVNIFSVVSGRSHRFLGINQYSEELMCRAQGYKTMPPLEIGTKTSRFGIRCSTTTQSHPMLRIG